MAEMHMELHERLGPFRARLRRLLIERYLVFGAGVAGGVAVLLVVLDHLLTGWYVDEYTLLALFVVGALAGAIYGATRPVTDFAAALTIERRRNLRERASTAVAMAANAESPAELRDLITRDAIDHLTAVSPAELFPRRFTRRQQVPLALWALAVLLAFLPAIPWLYSPSTREERRTLQQSGKELKQYASEMLKHPDVKHSKTATKLVRQMHKLGVEMERLRIPKKEALVRLNKLQEEMKNAEAQIGKELKAHDREAMKRAAEAIRNGLEKRSQTEKANADRAREQMAAGTPRDKLSKEERAALQREERMQSLAKNLEKGESAAASEDLRKMGEQLQRDGEMSKQDRQQMGQTMRQAAKEMEQTSSANQQMSQTMRQASQQLQQGTQQGQQQAGQAMRNTTPIPPNMMPGEPTMGQMRQGVGQCRQGVASNKPCPLAGSKPGGTKPGGQGGQPGQGQGQGQGQNQGNNQGPNNQVSTNNPNANSSDSGGTSGGEGGSKDHFGNPEGRLGAGTDPVKENADIDPEKAAYSVDIKGAPGKSDRTNVPYYEVLPGYKASAESAINTDQVPASERQRVKEYFDELNPETATR